MILGPKEEERLESSTAGRAVLRNLANSILGQVFQVVLLLSCLGIYTFTPEIISYSKMTDRGLTGIVEATGDSKVAPLTRIDREMRLTPENWPDVSKHGWERITITWSGFLEIPDEAPFGEYSFSFADDEEIRGKVWSDDAPNSCEGKLRGATDAASRILCVVKSESSPIKSLKIKVKAQDLPATAESRNLELLFRSSSDFPAIRVIDSSNNMKHATYWDRAVPRSWLRIDESAKLDRSVTGVEGPQQIDGVKPYKSQPYLDASVVVVNRLLCVVTTAVIAFGSGGLTKLKACFDLRNILRFAPCAVCYAIADIAEILANGAMDPTVYIILSQSRLLLTALSLKLWMGTSQTTLQWIDLAVLTLLVVIFQFIPSTFETAGPGTKVFPAPGSKGVPGIGKPCAFLKIMMSVIAGVYTQKLYQGDTMPFVVQLCNLSVTGSIMAIIALPVSCMLTGSLDVLLEHGLFAGPDYPYGWDRRVIAVIGIYQT